MGAYILRRLLLVIPTLFGVMVLNFVLTQFVPGGPIEQVAAQLEGGGDSLGNLTGANADGMQDAGGSTYAGARGLPPEFLAELEVEFGFARFTCDADYTGSDAVRVMARSDRHKEMIPAAERFFLMMGKYLTFDFGTSYSGRSRSST